MKFTLQLHAAAAGAAAAPGPPPPRDLPRRSFIRGFKVRLPNAQVDTCGRCTAPWPCLRNHLDDTCPSCHRPGHITATCLRVHPELKNVMGPRPPYHHTARTSEPFKI